jgi:hypothetical protein
MRSESSSTPVRVALGLVFAVLASSACEPMGPLAGGRLAGELQTTEVADWSFAHGHDTIQLETRPDDPHSVTVWAFTHEGRLYVPSRHAKRKRWVQNVVDDPRVRVRIGDRIYPARATQVTDSAELEAAVPALFEKYDLEPMDEKERAGAWVFRLDWREPS